MQKKTERVLAAIVVPPHLSVSGGAGAGERLSHALARDWRIDVASMLNGAGEPVSRQKPDGLRRITVTSRLPSPLPWSNLPNKYKSLFYRSNIPEIIADGDYDLVHIHNPMPALEMARIADACMARNIPYVVAAHGFNEVANGARIYGFNPLQRKIWERCVVQPVRHAIRHADGVYALTEADFPFIRESGYDGSELVVVTNGVPTPPVAIRESDVAALTRRNIPVERTPGQITCMFLANHTPNKGVPILFSAFAELDIPYLLIVGGERRPSIDYDALSSRCGPNQQIVVTGRLEDDEVDACFRRSDLFVFPTLAETFGIVLLQAMSHGVPVIASRVGGIPCFVPSTCGELVDPGDAHQLARAVEALARDPARRKSMGERGRIEAAKHTWESAADVASASYKRILRDRARSVAPGWTKSRAGTTPNAGQLATHGAKAAFSGAKEKHVQRAFFTLLDQGAVSLGNFVVQIVLARWLIPAEYGTFALLLTLFFLVQHLHNSLIYYPLTLMIAGKDTPEPARLTSTSVAVTILSSIAFATIVVGGLAAVGRQDLMFGAAAFLVIWQAQDAMRRALMAELRYREAAIGDAVCYLGQAGAILLLAETSKLSLPNALVAMAAACGAGALVQAWSLKMARPSAALARASLLTFWRTGIWALLIGSIIQLRTNLFTWVLVIFGGTAAAGAYQAAMNIANFTNPVMFGLNNAVAPVAARTMKESGLRASLLATRTYVLVGAPIIFGYCALVFLSPQFFLTTFYSADSPYLGLDTVVRLVVLAAAINFLAEMVSTFLLGISQGHNALFMNAVALGTTILLLPLLGEWKVVGAGIALVAASIARLVGSFFALRASLNKDRSLPHNIENGTARVLTA